MPRASHFSIHLARFDDLRPAGGVMASGREGVLFCSVAADSRAAGTDPTSQQAFKFAILALHRSEASASQCVDDRHEVAPWLDDAREVWSAVLQPVRHMGEANYLNRLEPGPLFEVLGPPAAPDEPLVVVTSAGWKEEDTLESNRVREFGVGVAAVRASMTGVDGLYTQQSFFFPHGLEYDPMTVTFWRDEAAIRDFSYGQGPHRRQLDRYRAQNLADRTSFTRCRVLRSAGVWHGQEFPPARA